jgi:hypothetical protein
MVWGVVFEGLGFGLLGFGFRVWGSEVSGFRNLGAGLKGGKQSSSLIAIRGSPAVVQEYTLGKQSTSLIAIRGNPAVR